MAAMTEAAREAFLSRPRIGVLGMLTEDGAPVAIPIWFEWDGHRVLMFTGETSPKIRRLQHDARATLLVAAEVGEKEAWVALDGQVSMHPDGVIELAARLAARYWDLNDPERAATLQLWRDQASALRRLEIIPSRIRSYTG
jgi:nitroimidazol reductase NimA-like FMN-containing flavoprotein (pyridoxamine 5'-phosphate oxidase superfamily)